MSTTPAARSPRSFEDWLKIAAIESFGKHPHWEDRAYLLQKVAFQPTGPEQEAVLRTLDWQSRPLKEMLVSGGLQSGKSTILAALLFSWHLWCEEIWNVAPDFTQARAEMRYLARWLAAIGNLDHKHSSMPEGGDTWTLRTLTGCKFRTFSGQQPAKLAGAAPDIIHIAEAGQCTEETLHVARARVTPKRAKGRGFLWLSGTLEGSTNWYAALYSRWEQPNDRGRTFVLPAWTNTHFYPGGRHDAVILDAERELPPALFAEKIAGRRTRPSGLVLSDFDQTVHVRPVRLAATPPGWQEDGTLWLDPATPIEVWMDPGFSGSAFAVLAVARDRDTFYVIDELYVRGLTIQKIIPLLLQKPWWRNVRAGVIDIAGQQHQANEAVADILRAPVALGGAGLPMYAEKVPLTASIDRLRATLLVNAQTRLPQLVIDPQCSKTIWEAADAWRLPVDGQGVPTSGIPINKDDHAAAALRYGFWARLGPLLQAKGGYKVHRKPTARLRVVA